MITVQIKIKWIKAYLGAVLTTFHLSAAAAQIYVLRNSKTRLQQDNVLLLYFMKRSVQPLDPWVPSLSGVP
jgi:hypothetical protein